MFRWSLQKAMGNSSSLSASERSKVDQLVGMGFDESVAVFALKEAQGDLEKAINSLLTQATSRPSDAERRERAERAAQAAQSRQAPRGKSGKSTFSKALASFTPKAQPFEKKLESACAGLAEYPAAVDMLVYIIQTILSNPGVPKYREIKTTTSRFKETIGTAKHAGVHFLEVVGFKQSGDWLVLGSAEDSAKLWLAKSALENVKESPLYRVAKERQAFEKALRESVSSASQEEEKRRGEFVRRVPVEPELGAAGTTRITVFCGEKVWQRRFNADDTLEGVIMWLGAHHSSLIPRKLAEQSWELVDRTLYPPRVLDVEPIQHKTLQALQLWPSAELLVQAAGTLEAERKFRERDANDKE